MVQINLSKVFVTYITQNQFYKQLLEVPNLVNYFGFRLAHTLTEVYGPVFGRGTEKLSRLILETRNQVVKSNLAQKMSVAKRYYTLEMSLPSFNEFQRLQEDVELVKDFIKSGCYKYLTVKQAWLLLLMCTEVGLWFFMGETIGKMHIVGYKV
ncbi:unnamed protein product [Parnassius apollo]|uniref:(apollo) hypothetical protein n=1 Tax=Parnassius apollo TaxID=110799 RepID=A0A8S3XU95_PARAO|nr:unnamed protein product [Parnassius apollo]